MTARTESRSPLDIPGHFAHLPDPRHPAFRDYHKLGEIVTMYSIDAGSGTLTNDMLTVFRRNVTRARRKARETGKKFGVAAE